MSNNITTLTQDDEKASLGMLDKQAEDNERAKPEVWPKVVTLEHPVDSGRDRISSLEFRRGTLADIKGVKLGETVPTEQLIAIAARLSGQSLKVIESLDSEDAGEVMSIALDFYGRCLTDGKKRRR